MNHFHLRLSNDPVAGAAGRATINAKLKARLFGLDVRQYQGFSAWNMAVAARKIFACYQPWVLTGTISSGMRLLNSIGWIRKYKNNKYSKTDVEEASSRCCKLPNSQ
jgi:hypothetical protein